MYMIQPQPKITPGLKMEFQSTLFFGCGFNKNIFNFLLSVDVSGIFFLCHFAFHVVVLF